MIIAFTHLFPRWIPDLLLGWIPNLLPALLPRDFLLPIAGIVMFMVFMVLVVLVYVLLANAEVEAQAEAVANTLLSDALAARLGLGCLLIADSFGMDSSAGNREHAEQTQLRKININSSSLLVNVQQIQKT